MPGVYFLWHSIMQGCLNCQILRAKLMVYKQRLSEYELVSSDEDY